MKSFPARMLMAISVAVPKNLSGIKTKVAMNLTKRQLICFGGRSGGGNPFLPCDKGSVRHTGFGAHHGSPYAAFLLFGNV